MIQPNRLSNPGENAALARVRTVVERLDAAPIERIGLAAAPALSPEAHARLVARLEAAADRAGRRELLDQVRGEVRTTLAHRFSPLVANTGIGFPNPVNTAARPADQARIIMAVVDAVAVAVMEDRLDPRTAAALSDPGRGLLGLPPLGEPDDAPPEPGLVEPTADAWAEAAEGGTRIGDEAPNAATARIVVAVVMACVLGPAALFAGVAAGSTLVGMLAGLAVAALCWLLATFRR